MADAGDMNGRANHWPDDVLDRRRYADFLTAYLKGRVVGPDGALRSFTLALDAGWGSGKTFFIERWARDLRATDPKPHVATVFNAWAADFAADPLVAFMAAFKSALDAEVKAAGLGATAKTKVRGAINDAMKGLRRAMLPTAKQLGKGIAKVTLGVSIDEISEAIQDGDLSINDASIQKLEKGSLEALNKSLDSLFAKALQEQTERSRVIDKFRASIELALGILVNEGNRASPMFVFVDELDRCRPSFALALLEGLKHVFGINGVCFVVSTHLGQLAEATKAVYGPGFDGRTYLKRFFDIEFALPPPPEQKYAAQLFKSRPLEHMVKVDFGFPTGGFIGQPEKDAAAAFAWVATAFKLTLRDQEQVFEMVSAAAPMVTGERLCFLWLTILCAIRHRDALFFELMTSSAFTQSQFNARWNDLGVSDVPRVRNTPRHHDAHEESFQIVEVASLYFSASIMVPEQGDHGIDIHDYPSALLQPIFDSLPHGASPKRRHPSPIRHYYDLVRSAAHLSSTIGT